MNRSEHQQLIEQALAGKLAPEEKRRFDYLSDSDPAFRTAWQEEKTLDNALANLPQSPISSNFTSLVLQAVQAAQRETATRGSIFGLPRWSLRQALAAATVILGLCFLSFQHHQESRRQEMAQNLSALSEVASILPATSAETGNQRIDLLKNFEAIQTLAYIPSQNDADVELLSALEK